MFLLYVRTVAAFYLEGGVVGRDGLNDFAWPLVLKHVFGVLAHALCFSVIGW